MDQKFPFEHFLNFNSSNINTLNTKAPEQDKVDYGFLNNNFKNLENKPTISNSQNFDSSFSTDELISITQTLNDELKKVISTEKYEAFFANNFTVAAIKDEVFHIKVTNRLVKMMFEKHYKDNINEAIQALMGKEFLLNIEVMNETSKTINPEISSPKKEKEANTIKANYSVKKGSTVKETSFTLNNVFTPSKEDLLKQVDQSAPAQHPALSFGQKIDKSKTFENFIVGPSNNMAHAFAHSVAKAPGTVYPQLYLYGSSGLGKTHLLHSICNYISETKPNLRINLTSANAFMNEMVMAIQKKEDNEFRRRYSELVDILIIDDIHELKNKERTQNEFFHIFNELQSKGKQLIFTSDKPPKEIDGIEDRIRTRLSSALLTEIQQPDLETRIAILRKKAIEKDIYLDDEVVNFIATCVKSNIRELEGSLIKLHAYSDICNVDIDLETAKRQLGLSEECQQKEITTESIAKAVSSYFKIPLGDIRGKSRVKQLTHARHIGMYLTYKILKIPLTDIGQYYGRRDHTTVMSAVNKFKDVKDNEQIQQLYEIESSL